MTLSADGDLTVTPHTIDIAQPERKTELTGTLRRITQACGRAPGTVLREWMGTSFGPGKLTFDEYIALGLYDADRFAGADLRSFVGLRVSQDIWRQVNFRTDLYGMVHNKVGMSAILQAHGFATIPILALYAATGAQATSGALHSRQALRAFLTQTACYPLFGKPIDGRQSLGTAGLARYDARDDALIGHDGRATPLEDYIDDIVAHYGNGYLFQRHVSPHPDTREICGDRLSTVRVLTLHKDDGPIVLRACEKIPGGANAADNFWREGNLLARIDRESAKRTHAISGHGLSLRQHSHHPDNGAAIVGTCVPNWRQVCDLALDGARLLKDLPLIGWDIAPTQEGAVIVEVNYSPDLLMPQMADCRGILDAEMRAALEHGKRAEKAYLRDLRRQRRESLRPSFIG